MIFRGPFQFQPFCDSAVMEVGVLLAINLVRDVKQHMKSFYRSVSSRRNSSPAAERDRGPEVG